MVPVDEVQEMFRQLSEQLGSIGERIANLEQAGPRALQDSGSRTRGPRAIRDQPQEALPEEEVGPLAAVLEEAEFSVSWGIDYKSASAASRHQTPRKCVFVLKEPVQIPKQPCEVLQEQGWLLAGDLDAVRSLSSAANPLNLTLILFLAPEKLDEGEEEELRSRYLQQGVRLEVLQAVDEQSNFNLVRVSILDESVRICQEVQAEGGRCMVACWGGRNRTSFLCTLLLVRLEGFSVLDALRRMVERRGRILTHEPCKRALEVLLGHEGLDSAVLVQAHMAAVGWEWCSHFQKLLDYAVETGQYEELKDSHGFTLGQWAEDQSTKHPEHGAWWSERLLEAHSLFDAKRREG